MNMINFFLFNFLFSNVGGSVLINFCIPKTIWRGRKSFL